MIIIMFVTDVYLAVLLSPPAFKTTQHQLSLFVAAVNLYHLRSEQSHFLLKIETL